MSIPSKILTATLILYQLLISWQIAAQSLNPTIQSPNWTIAYISQPKYGMLCMQARDKALFVAQSESEIYNFTTGQWVVSDFVKGRRAVAGAVANNNIYLAGGGTGPFFRQQYSNRVDIYNAANDKWSAAKLSTARIVGAAGNVQNLAMFAGGINGSGFSNKVDIFDATNNKHTTATLSQQRTGMAVGAAANEIIFAGGEARCNEHILSSNSVDIYNAVDCQWKNAILSLPRHKISVASVGSKIIFAGGIYQTQTSRNYSANIDIYDAQTGLWATTQLSEAKYGMTVAIATGKAYFAGGVLNDTGKLSDRVEIYDIAKDSWSYTCLPVPRAGMSAGTTALRLMFAGGSIYTDGDITDRIEVLTLATGQWSTEHLHQPMFGLSVASYNNVVLFVGGACVAEPYPHCIQNEGAVDIWNDNVATYVFPGDLYHADDGDIIIEKPHVNKQTPAILFADARVRDCIDIDLSTYRYHLVCINVLDKDNKHVRSMDITPFESTVADLDISVLTDGYYSVVIECAGFKTEVIPMLVRK